MTFPQDAIEAALAEALDRPVAVRATTPLGGGCIHNALRLDTSAGPYFAKWQPRPPAGLFGSEADGLAALADSPTTLTIPRPLAWSDGEPGQAAFLVTEWLDPGRPGPGFDRQLGEGLAALHRATAEAFGFHRDGYCGLTPQPNGWLADWLDFYRERRLEHQLRRAVDGGRLDSGERRLFGRLLERLDDRLAGPAEPPALIHGDLWSGNLLVAADGGPALVDPAAYFAHREAELGMMTLFGGFGPAVYEAYDEAWPLAAEWRERNGLYQLYHVLNHLNLFGEAYRASAVALARRYG
jgi:fructosamine-3-kinase